MKKTITLASLALVTFFANAQTEKNNWLVGGAVGFTSSTQKESDVAGSVNGTVFQLTPNAGYFFVNNLAAGIGLNLSSTHTSSDYAGGTSSTTLTYFTAGPFVRYYFNASPKVKVFLHGDASWGSEKFSYSSGGNDQSEPGIPLSIYDGKAGVAVFLNRTVALEFTAGYQSMTEKDNSGSSTIKYTTGSVIVGVSFQLYLGKK